MNKKLCFVIGTRPEIIKISPLIKEVVRRKIDFEIIHTGQHYDKVLYAEIWKDLNLPKIKKKIILKKSKKKSDGATLGEMIEKLALYLQRKTTKQLIVIVQGDTNSTLTGALVAKKCRIPLVHVEAGFRSHLKTQPEEINRILVDHLSDLNITADDQAFENLQKEGFSSHVFPSFNTAYAAADSMLQEITKNKLNEGNVGAFRLMTIHRAENVDSDERLLYIWQIAHILAKDLPLVWVIHHRTKPRLEKLLKTKLKILSWIKPSDLKRGGLIFLTSQGHKKFFQLLASCHSIYSDSGGIVDEAVYLGKPYICLRNETEHLSVLKKKRMLLLSPELNIVALLHSSKLFEKDRYPKLSLMEKRALLKAPKVIIDKIMKYF